MRKRTVILMPKYAIAWDIGHCGNDSGASGNGLVEKDRNIKDVNYTMALLALRGINQHLVHTPDENPSLQERAFRARDWGADLLISVHHNAGGGVGYDIIKSVKGILDDQFSDLLATEFKAAGQKAHGGVGIYEKRLDTGGDYYGILRYAASVGLPSVIGEFAFLDSADSQMIDSDYKLQIEAEAYSKAICKLCGVAWDLNECFANALAEKKWSNSPTYWTKVFNGEEIFNLSNFIKLLSNITGGNDVISIVSVLMANKWCSSPDYWISVLQGKQTPNMAYVIKLLSNTVGM